jgi:hypothetical protein
MRSTICAFRSELKTIQHEMKAIWSDLDETTACNGATKTKSNPGMMQSTEEHHEIPKGEAAVMPVGGPRKRRRVCNLAAERLQKMKDRTQGYCGSRRELAAACGKVSRCAKVARHKKRSHEGRRSNRDGERSRPRVREERSGGSGRQAALV